MEDISEEKDIGMNPWIQWFRNNWKYVVIVATPLLLSVIPIVIQRQEAYCGYIVLVMAVYWMTEAVPLAVTALMPAFAFPLLGILSSEDCTTAYLKPTNMLKMGGLMAAVAIEHSNLHKRIALFVMLHVGQSPSRLMTGIMLTTTFLSMWISNSATAAMMVPIVSALLKELYPEKDKDEEGSTPTAERMGIVDRQREMQVTEKITDNCSYDDVNGDTGNHTDTRYHIGKAETSTGESEKAMANEKKFVTHALFLVISYSANIGGTGVVTGASPNMVMMAQIEDLDTKLNFATWMAFNMPGVIIYSVLCWIWLNVYFMGLCRKKGVLRSSSPEREAAVRRFMQRKYEELGSITQQEGTIIILFALLILLLVFRNPVFVEGWTSLFTHDKNIADCTAAVFIALLLFALPSAYQIPWSRRFREAIPTRGPEPCLTWKVVAEKVPWDVIILIGGGSAMADGVKSSGLSTWFGSQFNGLQVLPKEAIVLIFCLMISMVTEVISNTATALVFLQVLKDIALNINVNPLYLLLPATVCCSFAFMLPVATPPNAIIFSVTKMRTIDMMKAGIVMNIICVAVLNIMINTLGVAMFDLYDLPPSLRLIGENVTNLTSLS